MRKSADLTGQRFGKLVVQGPGELDPSRNRRWICLCDCGGMTSKPTTTHLRSCKSESCGCRDKRAVPGHRFGKWTLLRLAPSRNGKSFWWCRCDCGTERIVKANNLMSGITVSCGCGYRLPHGVSAKRRLWRTYRNEAARRGLEWGLSEKRFFDLVAQPCRYCGREPFQVASRADRPEKITACNTVTYTGIDRVNNDRGYVPRNVVPCCGACNMAKGTMSHREFLALVSRIYNHSIAGKDQAGSLAEDVNRTRRFGIEESLAGPRRSD